MNPIIEHYFIFIGGEKKYHIFLLHWQDTLVDKIKIENDHAISVQETTRKYLLHSRFNEKCSLFKAHFSIHNKMDFKLKGNMQYWLLA